MDIFDMRRNSIFGDFFNTFTPIYVGHRSNDEAARRMKPIRARRKRAMRKRNKRRNIGNQFR